MRLLACLFAASLLTATAGAQKHWTVPPAFGSAYAPGSHLLPLGRTRGFIQTWYHGSSLPFGSYGEMAFRADETASAPATTHQIEIVLGNTTKTASTLSRAFSENLGQATVFRRLGSIDFPAMQNPQDPDLPGLWIKGDRPFVFSGPHLVVQVDVRTSTAFDTVRSYLTDAYVMTTESGLHVSAGPSCGGGQLIASYDGSTYRLTMKTSAPNLPVLFLIGPAIDRISLANFEMPTCWLSVLPQFVIPSAADGNGDAPLAVPFAAPPETLQVFAQGLHITNRNPRGLATTERSASLLGSTGCSTYLYNWSHDGLEAEVAATPKNRGSIILFRQ
jgi:hypothetical protein